MLDMFVLGGASVNHHPKEHQHVSMMVNFYVGWKKLYTLLSNTAGKGRRSSGTFKKAYTPEV